MGCGFRNMCLKFLPSMLSPHFSLLIRLCLRQVSPPNAIGVRPGGVLKSAAGSRVALCGELLVLVGVTRMLCFSSLSLSRRGNVLVVVARMCRTAREGFIGFETAPNPLTFVVDFAHLLSPAVECSLVLR